jgi:hypothetical protein
VICDGEFVTSFSCSSYVECGTKYEALDFILNHHPSHLNSPSDFRNNLEKIMAAGAFCIIPRKRLHFFGFTRIPNLIICARKNGLVVQK